jgi:regulator of sigma E protease
VLAAGSIMNLVWAIVLFIIIYSISGGPISNIAVIEAIKGRPAYEAGIRDGDIITAINGQELTDSVDGIRMINNSAGQPVTLSVLRNHPIPQSSAGGAILQEDIAVNDKSYEVHDQETLEFKVVPEGEMGAAKIGIKLMPNTYDFKTLPFSKAFTRGVQDGFNVIAQTVGGLARMVTGRTQADVAGPVKIMKMIKDQSDKGIFDLLYLTAILSVNIGLINLLPLPVLDGGRIVFLILEFFFSIINALTGLKLAITQRVEENIHFIGMLCLLALLVFVTYKDIASFFK